VAKDGNSPASLKLWRDPVGFIEHSYYNLRRRRPIGYMPSKRLSCANRSSFCLMGQMRHTELCFSTGKNAANNAECAFRYLYGGNISKRQHRANRPLSHSMLGMASWTLDSSRCW
jgi:hypothetical protein